MVAACIAPAGQPLSAGYQLPSVAPSGLGAMASHSSYSLGTLPSLFHFNLTQSSKSCVHYMLSNYLFECALSLCQDRKTKTLTGKSQEFWAQFSSVQFSSIWQTFTERGPLSLALCQELGTWKVMRAQYLPAECSQLHGRGSPRMPGDDGVTRGNTESAGDHFASSGRQQRLPRGGDGV